MTSKLSLSQWAFYIQNLSTLFDLIDPALYRLWDRIPRSITTEILPPTNTPETYEDQRFYFCWSVNNFLGWQVSSYFLCFH